MGLFSGISKAISGISSAISPFSGIIGAGLGYLGQQSANATNVGIADANNATSIELANTMYQRRVKDLAAAGLNPMLAYMGQGGGSGGASVPNLQQAKVENSAGSAARSGVDAANMDLIRANTATAETQAALNSATAAKVAAETDNVKAQTGLNQYQLDVNVANKVAKIWSDTKDLEARTAKSLTDRLQSSNDYNTINYLNEYALKQGFRNFTEAMKSLEFRNSFQSNLLQSYQLPKASAEGDFYSTDFGKSVAPYLNSANSLANTAGAAAGAGVRLRGLFK